MAANPSRHIYILSANAQEDGVAVGNMLAQRMADLMQATAEERDRGFLELAAYEGEGPFSRESLVPEETVADLLNPAAAASVSCCD